MDDLLEERGSGTGVNEMDQGLRLEGGGNEVILAPRSFSPPPPDPLLHLLFWFDKTLSLSNRRVQMSRCGGVM